MYIPKNKIITNQYSSNRKLAYKSNNQFYTGFYYKTYDGKYFTGKTPNDPPNEELILVEDTSEGFTLNIPQSKIAYSDAPTIFDSLDTPGYSEPMVVEYSLLKNVNLSKPSYKSLPYQFFPKPTEADYELGVFTRYFCVKINEPTYLELNKETFDSLTKKDSNWSWESYFPFSILWTIKGDKLDVERTNYNMVILQEKRMKRVGLKQFLRGNYRKFLKS